MKIIAFVVYLFLQVAFIPLAIIGVILTGYRQIAVSKQLGVSQTAIEVINGRWTMHIFGIRHDPASAELIHVLPNTSAMGLWLMLFPLWVQTKISGQLSFYPRTPQPGDEKILDLVVARTLYFDNIIDRVITDVDQFVLMGAGYDTRAYGKFVETDFVTFELDQPIVQAHKREMLAKTNIDSSNVRFVPVDFTTDDLILKLTEKGFDASKRTLFLWEGVTLYLSAREIDQTLRFLKDKVGANSALLVDLYSDRMFSLVNKSGQGKVLELTDEGLGFGLPFDTNWQQVLRDFVEPKSMKVEEAHFLGSNDKKGPYAVVAEILF